jgi:hypothetical protein
MSKTIKAKVRSNDGWLNYEANVTFDTADNVQSLIDLINRFNAIKQVAFGELTSYSVMNEYATIEVEQGTDSINFDISRVLVSNTGIYFTLLDKHSLASFEIGEYSIDDLKNIMKEMEQGD